MKLGRVVFETNRHLMTSQIFYLTSNFEDGSYDIRPPLGGVGAACAACDVIGSLYTLQFLIVTYTFVLVTVYPKRDNL